MYRYDEYDHAMVAARVEEFRDQARRRLEGKLTEDQFKPLRLMNGLYLQLHAYMLRVAIPYGTLDAPQMRALADIADRYDRGYGHFTTRQNIQYNWIKLEECADLLADLAKVEMHAIQTSGNCIRNISSDHFAGAAADEVVDPRPYAELLRQWSSFHPEFSALPRKFKIAVIASERDRAAMRLHDIGIRIVERDGALGAQFWIGGGMGRTPMIAPCIRDFVPIDQFVTYAEAALRVYNRYGRRDNKFKARIKILVHELSAAEYARQVEEEFAHLLTVDIEPPTAELARIEEHFAEQLPNAPEQAPQQAIDRSDPDFALWVARNTHPHKQPGYISAVISLKPVGGIPGDASAEQMRLMADLAERHGTGELRVTHTQNIVLPHVRQADLHALWTALDEAGLGAANIDTIEDIIACPGLDYCSLANARSIPVAQKISRRFADSGKTAILGELKLKISGCINACGHHHAGHIGILGVDKKGVENYQLSFGGSEAEDASLAKITGPGFDEAGIVNAVETATDVYLRARAEGERFLDTYRRIGMEPFKGRPFMAKRDVVFPANAHALFAQHGYSPAVRSGDLLFVSGMVGARPDGTPEPDPTAQVQLAFDNLNGVLDAAGASFDDVVDVTVFIVDPDEHFEAIMPTFQANWGEPPFPNITVVGATWLAGFLFEIKVIARLTDASNG